MNQATFFSQRGVTLVVSLIVMILITMMVLAFLALSNSNFKSVGNMQFRNEATAAANKAIEQVISSPFTAAPAAETINVDINNDGTTDYAVAIAEPVCIRATVAGEAPPSSLALPTSMSSASTWNTTWEIDATVADSDNVGGAAVRVRSGVRVLLSQAEKDAVCP